MREIDFVIRLAAPSVWRPTMHWCLGQRALTAASERDLSTPRPRGQREAARAESTSGLRALRMRPCRLGPGVCTPTLDAMLLRSAPKLRKEA